MSPTLKPTPGFAHLTASQRKSDAFLLGEALTHWFAQTHLGTQVVVPLESYSGTLVQTASSAPYPKVMPKYFRTSVKPGAKSEPDFLAFAGPGQVHVLESKGRAGFNMWGVTDKDINAARNKALRQVCKIGTVNGVAPVTRTACVFAFDQSGLAGQITDPPATRRYDYRAELPSLVRQAYAAILDPLFDRYAQDIDPEHIGIEFMPGWRFGIHRAVYKMVRRVEDDRTASDLLQFLGNFPPRVDGVAKAEDRSAGSDGLVLIGGPDFSAKMWREVRD